MKEAHTTSIAFINELTRRHSRTSEPDLVLGWQNVSEFETVGQLKRVLESFGDDCPLGFIHQPKQDLFYRRDDEGGMLGFQIPSADVSDKVDDLVRSPLARVQG